MSDLLPAMWLKALLAETVDAEDTSARSLWETAPANVRAFLNAAIARTDGSSGPGLCRKCSGNVYHFSWCEYAKHSSAVNPVVELHQRAYNPGSGES